MHLTNFQTLVAYQLIAFHQLLLVFGLLLSYHIDTSLELRDRLLVHRLTAGDYAQIKLNLEKHIKIYFLLGRLL